MRVRIEEKSNYKAIFSDGMTMRFPIDRDKPITELEYPEFYDVGINGSSENGMCITGNCPYCYTCASKNGYYTKNVSQKIKEFFSNMTDNQLPFQATLGGNGEPLEHPEIIDVLRTFNELGIVISYTTNGVLFNNDHLDLVQATKEYCGGVAITLHPHLLKQAYTAIDLCMQNEIATNLHVVISDDKSIDLFKNAYVNYFDKIDYVVLLPRMNVGFAKNNEKQINYEYLEKTISSLPSKEKLAFGANFYPWLQNKKEYGVSLYTPELMSKYVVFEQTETKIFNNSFELQRMP